jgi:hypothetical protein
MRKIRNDIDHQIITAVRTVIELKDENYNQYIGYLLKQLPIDSLTAVKKALKAELGDEYKVVRIRYRGPRPNTPKIPNTPENLLKIIALGKDAYRTETQRASTCLKHQATHYSIYKNPQYL